jgi:hypothetical protein
MVAATAAFVAVGLVGFRHRDIEGA